MNRVHLAVIGAGSFVFGPSVLHDVLVDHRLSDVHVALVDLDQTLVQAMAAAGQRVAADLGLKTTFSAHTRRTEALSSADFVICSAAVQMHRRFDTDVRIIRQHCPDHSVSEFGGIQGISYSLRQIALIEQIAADIRTHCPDAWLLDVANPMPRVAQAAHEAGVRTIGLCSASLGGYRMLWQLMTGQSIPYPYAAAREKWDAFMAGVNHFSFLLSLTERDTGRDLMPELQRLRQQGASTGQPLVDSVWRSTGYLPVAGDDHIRDFLPPHPDVPSRTSPGHGSAHERQQRVQLLTDIASGQADWRGVITGTCWEKPIDIVAAMCFGRPGYAHSLSLVNECAITNLPRHIFAETPCRLTANGPDPIPCTLPQSVLPLVAQAAQVADTIVRAARQRSRKLVHEAVELDPTIIDKPAGHRAIDACMQAHADLLPEYR